MAAANNRANDRLEPRWFEERVLTLLPELLHYAGSLTESSTDAEDSVSEAIAKAWENREHLSARERFRGWIFRIVRNCCLARHRRRAARPEEVPLTAEEDDESSFSLFDRLHQPFLLWGSNPETEFLNGLLKDDLKRAFSALPERYRSVVALAEVQGLSYAEIAEALEIPIGTVRSRLARGRSHMQELLWHHAVDAGLREPNPSTSPTPDTKASE